MDQYRKLILDSYVFMLSTQRAYMFLGFEICLLDELKELNGYMEGETFQMDILGTMEDKAVLRIHRFATETHGLIDKLYEDNNLLSEELDEYECVGGPEYKDDLEPGRLDLLALLCYYTEKEVSKITGLIDQLCYINSDPPMRNYTDLHLYDDENVKLIAAYYAKVMELNDDILETEIIGKMGT